MAQTYGTKTSSIMDRALALKSVFAPHVGDNGVKFDGTGTVQLLHTPDGSIGSYNEESLTPISVGLIGTDVQTLTITYNKAMFERIQRTLTQDIPVAQFVAKWARQQIENVFVPNHDVYSLSKVVNGRPVANKVKFNDADLGTAKLSLQIGLALGKIRKNGADANRSILWVTDTYSAYLQEQIRFTGSDEGYKDAKNTGYLGRHKGVKVVEVPDTYLASGIYGVMADKRAIINLTPKMAPENFRVIDQLSGFDGFEVQIRDRSDTWIFGQKAGMIATIEGAGSSS